MHSHQRQIRTRWGSQELQILELKAGELVEAGLLQALIAGEDDGGHLVKLVTSAFPVFPGSQGSGGGGQVQSQEQVEASSSGHCGMFWMGVGGGSCASPKEPWCP